MRVKIRKSKEERGTQETALKESISTKKNRKLMFNFTWKKINYLFLVSYDKVR